MKQPSNHPRIAALVFGAASVCIMTGCGGAYDATVRGTVTLDDIAVPRGTVTFKPVEVSGVSAYGSVREDGSYQLRTGREAGLPPGEYQVTVVARDRPESDYGKDGGPPPAGKLITPEWYRSPNHSGLKFTVEAGRNTIDLSLTSSPPEGWNPNKRRRRR